MKGTDLSFEACCNQVSLQQLGYEDRLLFLSWQTANLGQDNAEGSVRLCVYGFPASSVPCWIGVCVRVCVFLIINVRARGNNRGCMIAWT